MIPAVINKRWSTCYSVREIGNSISNIFA